MPPLDYVGNSAATSKAATSPQARVGQRSDSTELKVGDAVLLKGLSKTELNGQRGVLLQASMTGDGRLPVKLNGSELLIKKDNLVKVEGREDEPDDVMPPLEF